CGRKQRIYFQTGGRISEVFAGGRSQHGTGSGFGKELRGDPGGIYYRDYFGDLVPSGKRKTTKNFTKVQLLPENGKPGKRITGGTERISESPGENHRSDLRAVCGGIMDAENSIFSGTGAGSRNIGCI